jgi:polygalacturonase
MECYNYSPLIYAIDCENIAITGKGTLIGNGQAWWDWKNTQVAVAAEPLNTMCAEGVPVEERQFGLQNGLRPQFIQPFRCKNVLIEGITIKDGPFWTIHPVYCENIIVRGVTIRTHGPNTDGVNLDSCSGGLIEYCFFSTGDDSIALKSGMNEDGWRVGKPCENIVIRHCETIRGNGAVVIGSEMSGGVQNIYAHDMNIISNKRVIRIKSMRGRGGFVRNVYYENFNVGKALKEAIMINMKYSMNTVKHKGDRVPVFENIFIKNIHCEEAGLGLCMIGLDDQKIRNVTIENATVEKVEREPRIENVENLNIIGGNLK